MAHGWFAKKFLIWWNFRWIRGSIKINDISSKKYLIVFLLKKMTWIQTSIEDFSSMWSGLPDWNHLESHRKFSGRNRCEFAEIHTKSRQEFQNEFFKDYDLVKLVIRARLLRESVPISPEIYQTQILNESTHNFIRKPLRSRKH